MGNEWGLLPRLAKTLGLLFAAVAAACPAHAVTFGGSTSVVVIQPLTLVNSQPLSFGRLIPSAAPGTATVNAFTGVRSVTGGVTMAGGTVSVAVFQGLTDERSHIKITTPVTITVNRVGGGASMTIDTVTINGDKNNWIPANTLFEFQLGGRLNVGANQMTGQYEGLYSVTVEYR